MERVYNFSAGPSILPIEVLEKAQAEMLCYGDSGMSVMEMNHRTPEFEEILHGAESALRELMSIPNNYRILFLQLSLCPILTFYPKIAPFFIHPKPLTLPFLSCIIKP